MNTIIDGVQWLTTPDNWGGRRGIGHAIVQHLWYSFVATLAAMAIALPIGLWIGHTGRGRLVAANVSGLWRAIPTIGVVTLVFRWQPLSVWPVIAALVLLAVPPMVLNTVFSDVRSYTAPWSARIARKAVCRRAGPAKLG